ncbi:MAG TPA: hypothetical protein DCP68_05115 [Ruminococcus sp.]|nr:hypothetical protein [Ruminococcus sp.]
MKRTMKLMSAVCAAAAALTVCAAMPLTASAEANTLKLTGDFNNDKVIGAEDAQSTLVLYAEAVAGISDGAVDEATEQLDIDMDGKVSAADAEYILHYYCQTLVGDKPLWAEIRSLSYADGTAFYGNEAREVYLKDENGDYVLDENGQFVKVWQEAQEAKLKGMYIEIGCASGAAGETVTVPVYLCGLPKLAGFQLLIQHDLPLELVEIKSNLEQHPQWTDFEDNEAILNPNFSENEGCVVAAQAHDITVQDGYVVAEYEYQIPEDAKTGDVYTISVAPYYTKFITSDCDDYQYTALSGAVRVADAK